MLINELFSSRDSCTVCGQTPCNCTHVNEGVAEARAASAAFRRGNAQRAKVDAMSAEERRAYDQEQQEKQRKRDDARMERERQRNAAKKGVAEGTGDGYYYLQGGIERSKKFASEAEAMAHSKQFFQLARVRRVTLKYKEPGQPAVVVKEFTFNDSPPPKSQMSWGDFYLQGKKQGMSEGDKKPEPPEADYGPEYQDMVARVKKLAGMGPLKTVYDPQKRVYKNVPTAVQPKK